MGRTAKDPTQTVLAGGGELGALMRAFDWSKSPVGPVASWPLSLRISVSHLLASKAQIILFWGPEFLCFYNDPYRPVFGAKHPEALGHPARETWSEIWDELLHPLLAEVVRTGEAYWARDKLFVIERHGFVEETYFDVSYDPVRIESGEVGGVFCIVAETTERVVSERRLSLLRDLAARQTLARTTREACLQALETLAAKPEDVVFALVYVDHELLGATPGAEAQRAATPAAQVQELPIFASGTAARAGRLVVGLNPQQPFNDQYRTFLELVASQLGTAVAHARAYEEERKRAEALATLDQAKTTFFSNVSHEFRTPLTLILGPVEDLLTEGRIGSGVDRQRVELIHRNSLRLLKLVNTLLDFSRIEAGRVRATYQPTDLAALTTDLASAFRSAIEHAGMTLVVDCPPLGPVYVDRDMWEKIVLNLLSNALKYTLAGTITVRLRTEGATARLSVGDTGVGVPEADLPHLFERFHRAAGTKGRTHEGSGIGLALVQELARLHGGTVHAESTEGQGSTFSVTIPLGSAHLPADRVNEASAAGAVATGAAPYVEEALRWLPEAGRPQPAEILTDGGESALPHLPLEGAVRPRVLLADDNADMRAYVRHILSARYVVEVVADGAAALAAARRDRPQLVLADVMMPELDGFGLLRALRADPALNTVPVVLLSARAGEEARVEGWAAGADDYLVKPFSARELVARVESHVQLAEVRREAQAALRASESRFRALVLASSDVVYQMSPDWSEMRLLEGRDFIPDTRVASTNWLGRYLDPADQAHVLAAIQRAILTKGVFELEHRVKRVDGTLGWTLSRAVPILDPSGSIVEWFGTAVDITERKRLQDALRETLEGEQRARGEAERANRMKDEFLTMLSHELRTPLNAILGWSQILTHGQLSMESIRPGLETIERNARLQAQMIEDLLDVSRITEGKIRLDVQRVGLCRVVEQAIDAVRPAATARQIRLQPLLDCEADQVNGDPSRLQQVVWNLLSNAVKFTPKGGRIQVLLERVDSHVELSVSDTGRGISPDFLPYVFDRFRQADQTTTRKFGGLGLGLSIVKHLVELHGGTVRATSAGEGHGATFAVDLPLSVDRRLAAEPSTGDEALVAHGLEPFRPSGDEPAILDGVTVLYVDDEADARDLVTRVLTDLGARVVTADSAASGRQQLRAERPHVLVADIGMPDEDGYSLIRTVRALPLGEGGSTPAAAMTALARSEDRRRALLAGFQTHVAKPVDVAELAAVVASLAGRTGR